jgi:hypothetical protein
MPTTENYKINFLSKRGNVENEIRLPIAIYANFESVLKRIENTTLKGEKSNATQEHEALSYCVYVKSTLPESVTFKLPSYQKNHLCREKRVTMET